MLQVISVYDPIDPASIKMLTGDYMGHLVDDIEGRKIALGVGEFIESATDPQVLAAVHAAVKQYESMGCKVQEVNVDWMREAALANALMTRSDGAAVHRDRLQEHPEMFGEDVRRRLTDGANTTSTEYSLARRTQTEIRKRCELFFESYDLLLTPTTPIAAPTVEGHDAVEQAGRLTRFTAPFNLTGLPALSIPCGFTKEGLPIGLQIVSRAWAEAKVLNLGYAFEQATEWHRKKPMLNEQFAMGTPRVRRGSLRPTCSAHCSHFVVWPRAIMSQPARVKPRLRPAFVAARLGYGLSRELVWRTSEGRTILDQPDRPCAITIKGGLVLRGSRRIPARRVKASLRERAVV